MKKDSLWSLKTCQSIGRSSQTNSHNNGAAASLYNIILPTPLFHNVMTVGAISCPPITQCLFPAWEKKPNFVIISAVTWAITRGLAFSCSLPGATFCPFSTSSS
ncbi:hypothetical protein CEXT_352511 [Caerostris extrusa]|uniref:Uncharacterized protein n=1 Tax=Caerostris extrusa TaxID=172846 RepID=A0AAV4N8W5_CAEEX|nr:hypothetical protein CEXT_352511 [Caerostris extrusa]